MGVIIDIGVCLIFLIALLVGAVRGLCKQFSGALLWMISVAAAVVLVIVVYPFLERVGFMVSFVSSVSGWFSKPMYTTVVGDVGSLQQTMSGSYLAILSGVAEGMFNRMQSSLSPIGLNLTIGNFFGKVIVDVLVGFILWLIFYLAIKYLLKGIKYLLGKITSIVVFKSIDKVLGVAWSLMLTHIIVIGIIFTVFEILISRFLPSFGVVVADMISHTTVLKFLHNTNVFGSFLASLVGVPLLPVV